jgi:hypothetical protein
MSTGKHHAGPIRTLDSSAEHTNVTDSRWKDNWKVVPDLSTKSIEYVPFPECRKFFAADNSGSTAGAISRSQRAFVECLQSKSFAHKKDSISLWGTRCGDPTEHFDRVQWTCNEGTYPSQILKHSGAVEKIQKSDAWFLLTDGEVWDGEVHAMAEKAHELGILNVPIIFVIVGSRGRTPQTTNISVGISFYAAAQDSVILFKETQTGKIYVISGKGCFAPLVEATAALEFAEWTDLPCFESEASLFGYCKRVDIKVVGAKSRDDFPKGISLGTEWEEAHEGPVWVDLDLLLEAGRLRDADIDRLFAGEAFSNLSVAYKTRKRIPEIRAFVQAQKFDLEPPKLEDVYGAAAIIAKMADPAITDADRNALQGELRDKHAKNRKRYEESVDNFSNSPRMQSLRKRNQLVDAALRTLASIEAAGFNAEILSRRSNRARRAENVTSDASIDMANLVLTGPAYKGYCLICCGEDEIMSICLKELDDAHKDDNTTDFALNFPLAAGASGKNVNMLSSQNVCFQCALLGPDGLSIYKEPLKAIIPAVQYNGVNKKYINDQLYRALTAGLATGAAGIAQLFMAILDQVLSTKSWAGAGLDAMEVNASENHEAAQRQRTFRWMLDQLVEHTRTRETFSEVGDWVAFPQALQWVAKDFDANGLASFAVTYPVAGFDKLVSLGQKTGALSEETVHRLETSKVVYSVAAKYLADTQKAVRDSDHSKLWMQKYLAAMYKSFNAPLVPRDLGTDSLVTDVRTFTSNVDIQHSAINNSTMHKAQVLLFWLLHTQSSPCTAQTFFTRISQDEPLAAAVLDPTLTIPESELHNLLLSPFAHTNTSPIDPQAAGSHTGPIPFRNPFGASVLQCGSPTCGMPFLPAQSVEKLKAQLASGDEIDVETLDAIRRSRAQHLISVFGLKSRFEKSQTGLPERREKTLAPPSSMHTSLHVGVVRTWVEQSIEQRRRIVSDSETDREDFVVKVCKAICEAGRGNVFGSGLEDNVRAVLPSFFEVLGRAVEMKGDRDIKGELAAYVHVFEGNGVGSRVRWEVEAWGLEA